MHLANDKHAEQLIDLGSVVEQTKGNAQGQSDAGFQQQLGFGGIADD